VIMSELWIDREWTAAHFSKEERKKLIHLLSGQLKVTIINRRPGDEFVTAWWISLAEIDPKTMQSKIIPWMYFAGEILNVDGVTWWFNLQAAWAMGRVAWLGIS
jgi:predicted flavoprotein YhiN